MEKQSIICELDNEIKKQTKHKRIKIDPFY